MNKKTIYSRDFILVAIGQIISLFGNQILRFALPLYLLNKTGSAALFGTISASAFIPMVVLLPIGGIIADRVNKRNIMVILDFTTTVLISLFCVLNGAIGIVPLMAVTLILLYAIQGAYQPAVKAIIPVLVDAEHLVQANSVADLISSLAGMAGPVAGGILFSIVGLAPILYISIGCFFASAVMEIFIHIPFEKKEACGNIVSVAIGDLKESFAFIMRKQPFLWKVSLVYACENLLLTTLILIGLPVLITQRLGFSEDLANQLYGYALGVITAGLILGGLIAGILSKRLKASAGPFLLAGCGLPILIGGAALQFLSAPMAVYIALAASCGVTMMLATVFQIQIMSIVQILTPKDIIGKVIACVMGICMCTNPLGQFIYGLIFEKTGGASYLPFYAAGLIMTGIAVSTRRVFNGIL